MASWQWFGRLHLAAYRATRGGLGGRLAGISMLLLTTRGRKSGVLRTTPLAFMADGDAWVVVGSNNGGPHDPAWWRNLEASPEAEVQVMGTSWPVLATLATGEERVRLWPELQKYNPAYARYETRTTRQIPVVVLRRRQARSE